ncbi:MAG: hypothetical protein COT74_01390 [Bdellovibrionales bacterium CG10_big_fil_rev_8_21_14_0_10_45_34]|nr:MAG: hypothetical protein COT74_01390 [Bdellovibrionales bacterium CG10_big_fil_rev_8_21_14_0_10_45_34]
MLRKRGFLDFLIATLFASGSAIADSSAQIAPQTSGIPSPVLRLGEGSFLPKHVLLVDKSKRKVTVWRSNGNALEFISEAESDFGKREGDKRHVNDLRTPEGIYFFESMLEGQQISFDLYGVRAFTTNYPNLFDRRLGKTGSGIWLHAIPDTESLERGSRGCVVVRNKSILDLSKFIDLKRTALIIVDELHYLTANEYQNKQQMIVDRLQSWKSAWEAKDIDDYISFYSEQFKSMKMDRERWKVFKQALNKKYNFIKVEISQPIIYEFRDQIVVQFLQKYSSDGNEDFGLKTLYMQRDGENPQIIAEEWEAVDSEQAGQELVQYPLEKISSSQASRRERPSFARQ